jgi:hypothetical protein
MGAIHVQAPGRTIRLLRFFFSHSRASTAPHHPRAPSPAGNHQAGAERSRPPRSLSIGAHQQMSRWMGVVAVSSWSPDPSIGMVPTPRHSAARARQAAGTYGLTPTLRKALVVLVLVRGNDEDVQPVPTETRMYRTRSSNSFFSQGSWCRRVLTCTWLDSTYGRRRRVPGTNFGVSRHVHAILYGSRRRLCIGWRNTSRSPPLRLHALYDRTRWRLSATTG